MTAIDEIKAKVDVVELVGEQIELKNSGRNFKANCPFHNERTPSFYVFPDSQTWRCFGACATGGDVLSFHMRREGVDFAEAVRVLAARAGVELESSKQSRARSNRQRRLQELTRAAAMFFHNTLLEKDEAAQARAYLDRRGLNADTIEEYRLGYSPVGIQGLQRLLTNQEFSEKELVAAGLMRIRDDGRLFSFFRGRLMIPIQDARGDYVGFGARALDEATPKYINSAQSDLFDKGSVLYGLHRAAESIKEDGNAVIVEGYMDVLTAHQHGFRNVIASMGTALTDRHVGALRRLGTTFVLALDPDVAGEEATLRSLESAWRIMDRPDRWGAQAGSLTSVETHAELVLQVLDLPQGKDPDALIRENPERWRDLLSAATPVVDYVFQALARRFDTDTATGKARLTERLRPFIHNAPNVFEQNVRIKKLADLLKEEDNTIRLAVGGATRVREKRSAVRQRAPVGSAFVAPAARDPRETYVLAMLLRFPELREVAEAEGLPEDYFESAAYQRIFRLLPQKGSTGPLSAVPEENLEEEAQLLLQHPLPPANYSERQEGLKQTIRRLKERWAKQQVEACQLRLAEPGTTEEEAMRYDSAMKQWTAVISEIQVGS